MVCASRPAARLLRTAAPFELPGWYFGTTRPIIRLVVDLIIRVVLYYQPKADNPADNPAVSFVVWVKALNEPLIMSTAQLRTTGGDHLVETGFVTRGLVSVRMDTRRNIRRGNQNQQQEPTTRTTLIIEPLSLSTTPMRSPGGDHLVETGFVTRGLVSVRMDTRRNVGVEDH